MTGVKGRSGRKRAPTRIVTEALAALCADVPELLEALRNYAMGNPIICEHCGKALKARKPDPDAIIYLIDRAIGRPKQETSIDLKTSASMAPEDYELAVREAQEAETRLLAGPDIVEGQVIELPDNTAINPNN